MSSKTVRDAFTDWMVANAPLPFVPTLNTVPEPPTPAQFSTLGFGPANAERVSLGAPACYRERGTVDVIVATPSGKGYQESYTFAEAVRSALWGHIFPEGIRLDAIDPPFNILPDDGNYLLTVVPVAYVFDFYQ